MTWRIRLHGRGGTGVKLASRIISRAAFLAGREVQDSPIYGAERRGAPVAAFVRIGDRPIRERGYIDRPDVLVVMDAALFDDPLAGVLSGVDDECLVLVNGTAPTLPNPARVVTLDLSDAALAALGQHVLSSPTAAFVVATLGLAGEALLRQAIRVELEDAHRTAAEIASNVALAERVYARTPRRASSRRSDAGRTPPARPSAVPHLPAAIAAPAVTAGATSAQRTTEGWRVWRPVIALDRCTRCALCFALCPEGAIHLDADESPRVDYAHCKGCLVCVQECPVDAITAEREVHP